MTGCYGETQVYGLEHEAGRQLEDVHHAVFGHHAEVGLCRRERGGERVGLALEQAADVAGELVLDAQLRVRREAWSAVATLT